MFGLVSKKKAELELKNLTAQKDFELERLKNTISELEKVSSELGEKNSELDKKNLELEKKNSELGRKNSELEKKNSELISNPEIIKNILKEQEVEKLTEEKGKLLNKQKELEEKLEDVEDELEELEDDLKDEKKKHEQRKAEYNELHGKCSSLEEEKGKLLNKQKELEDNLKDEKKKHEQKKAEYNELHGKCSSLEEEKGKLLNKQKELEEKLEDAEDELEELEDDLKDEKKKHEQKKAEYNELHDKYMSLEKENQTNKENMKKAENTIKSQGKNLTVKDGSLYFVREILKAKEVESIEYSKIDEAMYSIWNLADCIFKTLCIERGELGEYLFGDGLRRWVNISKKTWLKNKTAVAFVGEFSAGKTSIVNKILSQGGDSVTLPVSAKVTTAIPTYISHSISAGTAGYKFLTPDNILKKVTEKIFNGINKEILDEVDGISNLIKYFIISVKNENLRNLSILDTPGFSSNNTEDAEKTLDVINECDALFWVFDVNAGTVNRSSLNVIKEHLKKPLFVVINKTDTKAPSEVAKVKDLIKRTFDTEGIKVQYYIEFSKNENPSKILGILRYMPKTNDTSDYIKRLKNYVDNLLRDYEKKVSDLGKEANKKSDACDACREAISSHIDNVQDICGNLNDTIVDSFKKHFWGDDKYELSEDQFRKIRKKLSKLSKLNEYAPEPPVIKALTDSINGYKDAATAFNKSRDTYREAEANRDYLKKCIDSMKEKLKKLKIDDYGEANAAKGSEKADSSSWFDYYKSYQTR